jgi:hypothetical protein
MRISSSAGGLDWCRVYLHTRPHLHLNTHDPKENKNVGAPASESSVLGGLSMSEAVSRAGGASSVASSTLSALSTQAGEDIFFSFCNFFSKKMPQARSRRSARKQARTRRKKNVLASLHGSGADVC